MALNTILNPSDLHIVLSRTYELYYEPELTKLRDLNHKILEWEHEISNSIQFEVTSFMALNDRFDEITMELGTFAEFLRSGIIAMLSFNETNKEKKSVHEFYEKIIFHCSQLSIELTSYETNKNLFVQIKLLDDPEFDEYDY